MHPKDIFSARIWAIDGAYLTGVGNASDKSAAFLIADIYLEAGNQIFSGIETIGRR
jgi:hypothetical protein